MFHQGNLQSGISLAIKEQKLVGVFVRDGSSESTTWENEWLQSGWVVNLLAQSAVLLRLEAGSTEAGFLSAFCTLSSIPAFIIIQNGQLKEHLASGVSKDDFINRLRTVLGASPIPGTAQTSTRTPESSQPVTLDTPLSADSIPQSHVLTQTPPPASLPPLSSRAKGKQKATSTDVDAESSAARAAQQFARDALRRKKQGEKDELARIHARIEADRAERKAQSEARKAERTKAEEETSKLSSQSTVRTSTRGSQKKEVHLNVRLFDGQTIRSTFPRTAKLQDDVRPWVDRESASRAENSGGLPPYFFKQIQAPLPSRELSAGDEAETLGDIELAPSATLVLQPVKGYTEAYSGGSSGIVYGAAGNVMGLVGSAFNLAGSAIGLASNTLSSVLGGAGAATDASPATQDGPNAGRTLGGAQDSQQRSRVRVRTLTDQRAGEPRNDQLYNGNQLNFEPRTDDAR